MCLLYDDERGPGLFVRIHARRRRHASPTARCSTPHRASSSPPRGLRKRGRRGGRLGDRCHDRGEHPRAPPKSWATWPRRSTLAAPRTGTVEPLADAGVFYKRWLSGVPQGAQVRVLGEQMWLARSEAEQREWQRYEAFANITFRAPRTKVVCTYDATQLPEPSSSMCTTRTQRSSTATCSTESKTFTDPATFAAALDSAPLEPSNGPAVEAELEDLRDLRILLVGEASRTELDTERTSGPGRCRQRGGHQRPEAWGRPRAREDLDRDGAGHLRGLRQRPGIQRPVHRPRAARQPGRTRVGSLDLAAALRSRGSCARATTGRSSGFT